MKSVFILSKLQISLLTIYLSASKASYVPLITGCKVDIRMMSISNDSCQKAMEGNFSFPKKSL